MALRKQQEGRRVPLEPLQEALRDVRNGIVSVGNVKEDDGAATYPMRLKLHEKETQKIEKFS